MEQWKVSSEKVVVPFLDKLEKKSNRFDGKSFSDDNISEKLPMLRPQGLAFLRSLLMYNPEKRMNASDALYHAYLNKEYPLPQDIERMPSFPSSHDIDYSPLEEPFIKKKTSLFGS